MTSLTPKLGLAKRIVRDLEADFDVNALAFRGVRIWPWLRNGLIFYYSQARGPLLDTAVQSRRPAPSGLAAADALYEAATLHRTKHMRRAGGAAALAAVTPADVVFVARGDRRAALIDGKAFQTEVDPLIYRLEGRTSHLKIDMSAAPAADENQLYFPALHADPSPYLRWLTSLDRAQAAALDRPRDEIDDWGALRARLPSLGGEHPPLPECPLEMAEKAALILYAARWFHHVIERARPQLVVSVGHNVIAHGIFLACHRAGVTCVDVQHGAAATRSKNIKWYGWQTVPDGGYEILPDFFWVWGDEAEKRIRATTNNPSIHQPVIGGDAWLSVCLELVGAARHTRAQDAINVLVTLAPFWADKPPAALIEAMAMAPESWTWSLRLHPDDAKNPDTTSELRATLAKAGVTNAEFDEASSLPLPVVLAKADRHVTLYSSVAVQATAFGLGTVFVHEKGADHFSDLKGRPGFSFTARADELLALLEGEQTAPDALISTGKELAQSAFETLLRAPPKARTPVSFEPQAGQEHPAPAGDEL